MNAATKTRLANILTTLAFIVGIIQTLLTSPPFTVEMIAILSTVFTYLTLAFTTWKQYLSPEVSNTATKVTLAIAAAATIAGLVNLVDAFHVTGEAAKWVKWAITVTVAILNVLSKQIFPSGSQKEKMNDLKFEK